MTSESTASFPVIMEAWYEIEECLSKDKRDCLKYITVDADEKKKYQRRNSCTVI